MVAFEEFGMCELFTLFMNMKITGDIDKYGAGTRVHRGSTAC